MNTKKCSSCGESKPTAEFFVDKSAPCGFTSRCKPCFRAARKVRYLQNRDVMPLVRRGLLAVQRDLQRTQNRITKLLDLK